jgi:hypothetical protein
MNAERSNGRRPNGAARSSAREQLSDALEVLRRAGYYAYLGPDDQNRWTVSSDTDDGHIDVRFTGAGYVIEAWDTSPGLFWDEEDERRFAAKERLARIQVPAIARGMLEPDQEVWWDETDHGVGARVSDHLGLNEVDRLPSVAQRMLDELNDLLARVERRLLD